MIAVKRIGSAGVAVLALVVGVGMSPAHAENPPGVDYSGPQSNPQVVYPEPVEVLYSVGTNDGAVSTKQKKDATITTLSGDVTSRLIPTSSRPGPGRSSTRWRRSGPRPSPPRSR